MKIPYKHLLNKIDSKPSIEEVSEKLFQLGHEHEIVNNIFEFEFTPNRGDCLSKQGILQDLKSYYDVDLSLDIFDGVIDQSSINFTNHAVSCCKKISFLEIEIEKDVHAYKDYLAKYFKDLNNKSINFFTDISNYLSYETGQPTHCYDFSKIGNEIFLEKLKSTTKFKTLLGDEITLAKDDLVFFNNREVINLAGIVGGMNSSCDKNTSKVLVECAYFNPESIIGKALKYDINSEAAHKFERGVDHSKQEFALRRFIKIVEDHATIKKISYTSHSFDKFEKKVINNNKEKVEEILGIKISQEKFNNILKSLGFDFESQNIVVPYHRSDVSSLNDIAEEIARVIGFNNIKSIPLNIESKSNRASFDKNHIIKSLLVDNGFYEVINNPFVAENDKFSIKIDNPLDSNKGFLRTNLKSSLINNLLYNERRQQDSIKLFEISNLYFKSSDSSVKTVLGIIASGRVAKNYKDFSKLISQNYIQDIFINNGFNIDLNVSEVSREGLNSKIKNPIYYAEIDLVKFNTKNTKYKSLIKSPTRYIKYKPISEYPSSKRDLSFSVTNPSSVNELEEYFHSFKNKILKEIFIFDYFLNQKTGEIKIGFRLVFQSNSRTITEEEVSNIIDEIINNTLSINSVNIPGLK